MKTKAGDVYVYVTTTVDLSVKYTSVETVTVEGVTTAVTELGVIVDAVVTGGIWELVVAVASGGVSVATTVTELMIDVVVSRVLPDSLMLVVTVTPGSVTIEHGNDVDTVMVKVEPTTEVVSVSVRG